MQTEPTRLSDFPDWPPSVRDYLRAAYGEPIKLRRLGGMSLARVYRVRFPATSVIVKASPSPKETVFYERAAGPLRRAGIPTPHLEWSAHQDNSHWLILEDIPNPLPIPRRDDWRADPSLLAVLCRLHTAQFHRRLELPGLYAPMWTDAMTDAALSLFPVAVAGNLAADLGAMYSACQQLFASRCWISGDPNPTNWGIRGDGTLVLYDWERFGRGTPALDLAIALPGLGDNAQYARLAGAYLEEWHAVTGSRPWSIKVLSRDIGLAKVWSVVEFLSHHACGAARIPEQVIDRLVDAVPSWVSRVRRSGLLP